MQDKSDSDGDDSSDIDLDHDELQICLKNKLTQIKVIIHGIKLKGIFRSNLRNY